MRSKPEMTRRALLAGVAGAVIAACGGGSSRYEATTTSKATTTSSTSSTSTTIATTTTTDPVEAARAWLESHPPKFPPPLEPAGAPVEPLPPPTPVGIVDSNFRPVTNEDGEVEIGEVQFDRLGRLLMDDAGGVLADGAALPSDEQGIYLWAVRFDDEGAPVLDDDGKPTFERLVPTPNRVLVIGDSVMLGAQADVRRLLEPWHVIFDAIESRLPGSAGEVVRSHQDEVGRVVVIMLGHNAGPGEDHLLNIRAAQQAVDALGLVDRTIWISAVEWSQDQADWNEALRSFVRERPEPGFAGSPRELLDWSRYMDAYPEYAYDDGVHLDLDGRAKLAELLARYTGPPPDCSPIRRSVGECA